MAENGVEDVEQEKQSLERDVYSKVQKSRNKVKHNASPQKCHVPWITLGLYRTPREARLQ